MTNWRDRLGFGIYIHWPYCEAKCPYCDFNSHVSRQVELAAWLPAYQKSLRAYHSETEGRVVTSVYFGGGTPSLMPAELVSGIISEIRALWPVANDVEITLEANPSSIEVARFEGYKFGGVNRVSIGIQALNDGDLKRLGRLHSASEALEALSTARAIFDRVSFDLIYARQDQSMDAWASELDMALSLEPSHLSLYQLTIEPNTAFGDRYKIGKLQGLPDSDLGADMFELTQKRTVQSGLMAYEISNHAAPGFESRHNQLYWRGGDYLGIGPGAHGRLTLHGQRVATETPLLPNAWLAQVSKNETGESERAILSSTDILNEMLMMGLRTVEGVPLDHLGQLGHKISEQQLDLEELGILERTQESLRATDAGRPLLNEILRQLLI